MSDQACEGQGLRFDYYNYWVRVACPSGCGGMEIRTSSTMVALTATCAECGAEVHLTPATMAQAAAETLGSGTQDDSYEIDKLIHETATAVAEPLRGLFVHRGVDLTEAIKPVVVQALVKWVLERP